jgi:hypothetical protein
MWSPLEVSPNYLFGIVIKAPAEFGDIVENGRIDDC